MLTVVVLSQSAMADFLTPGTFAFLSGTTPPAGVVISSEDRLFSLVDDTGIVLATGQIASSVVRETATGVLRFEFQITVDGDSPGPVAFLTLFNYSQWSTDVDFVLGSGGLAPTTASRSTPSGGGAAISFTFPGGGSGGGLQPGESSPRLFIRTNTANFDANGLIRVQQGLHIENLFNAFGPAGPVVNAPLFFSGQLDVVEVDLGGAIYSGVPLGTDFSGVIDDETFAGNISDGATSTSWGCCLAAGGLEIADDDLLDADTADLINQLLGSSFVEGDRIDSINLEGDVALTGGGRIEVGLSFILPPSALTGTSPGNYPPDPTDVIGALFFILEEDAAGVDIYSGLGALDANPLALALVPGINLLSPTAAIANGATSCFDLLNELGGSQVIASITAVAAAPQQIASCRFDNGIPAGSDFPAMLGESYFVELLRPVGPRPVTPPDCPATSLMPGVNLIGVVQPPVDLTCFGVLEAWGTGVVSTIERLDRRSQTFVSCTMSDGVPTGADYRIQVNEGVVVHAHTASTSVNLNDLSHPACAGN